MAKKILTNIDMNQHLLKNFALPKGGNINITNVADGYIYRLDDEIYMASNNSWQRFVNYNSLTNIIADSISSYYTNVINNLYPIR